MKPKKIAACLLFFSAFLILRPARFSPAQATLPDFHPSYVALTFDDGPWPRPTENLLQVLNENDAKGTFFIVGRVARKNRSVLEKIHRAGHELANHTWNHKKLTSLKTGELVDDLERTRRLIRSVTGKSTHLFRTPGSTRHYLTRRFTVPAPYQLVLWSVHSQDHQRLTAGEIESTLMGEIRHGDIVLLHNGVPETVDALKKVIPELKRRGFVFVTVSELLDMNRKNNLPLSDQLVRLK